MLSNQFGRPVLDQTGVTERYDIELQFSSQPLNTTTVDSGPALRTAITEQLGPNADDSRASIEVLIIDRVERPSEIELTSCRMPRESASETRHVRSGTARMRSVAPYLVYGSESAQ